MFLQNTLNLIRRKGITKNKLLSDLELGKNSFVDWESRGTIPGGETLLKIANYFNVSVDYLLTGKEKFANLSDIEQEIMGYIRLMSRDEKIRLAGQLEERTSGREILPARREA